MSFVLEFISYLQGCLQGVHFLFCWCLQGVHLSQVHQRSSTGALLALLVQFRGCTSYSVGALETSAPPKAPPKAPPNDSFCKGTANRRLHKTKATKKALPTEGNALIFIYISYSVAL